MPNAKPRMTYACRATKEGNVEFAILENGQFKAGFGMPPEEAPKVAAALLAAASAASEAIGYVSAKAGGSLAGGIVFRPSAVGLSSGQPPEPLCLVIHAGKAILGIALEGNTPRELARALQTMSAPQDRKQ